MLFTHFYELSLIHISTLYFPILWRSSSEGGDPISLFRIVTSNSFYSLVNAHPSQRKVPTSNFGFSHSTFCRPFSVGHAWLFTKWLFHLMSINVDFFISYCTIPYQLSVYILFIRFQLLNFLFKYAKWGLVVRKSGFNC